MASWIDVTAPANWVARAAVFGERFDYGDCTTAVSSPLCATAFVALDPGGSGGDGSARLDIQTSGNLYAWDGTKWAAGVTSPGDNVTATYPSDFPFLRYVGTSVTGITKWRVTAKSTDADSPFALPPGIIVSTGDTECPSTPGVFIGSSESGGTIPVGTTYLMESDEDSNVGQFITAIHYNYNGDTRQVGANYIMEITKIEAFGDADGAFWTDFVGSVET